MPRTRVVLIALALFLGMLPLAWLQLADTGLAFDQPGPEASLADGDPPDDVTLISTIQGSESGSPLEGEVVRIQAVVSSALVGDEVGNQLGGFYAEEEAADHDDDPATSEGIFVFAGGSSDDLADAGLAAGDRVEAVGQVTDRFGQVQVDATVDQGEVEVLETDVADELAPPVTLSELPPLPDLDSYTIDSREEWLAEAAELRDAAFTPFASMRVQLEGMWTVTDAFNLHTFGEVLLVPGDEPLTSGTNVGPPGPAAGALEAAAVGRTSAPGGNFRQLILDDTRAANLANNDLPAPYLSGGDGTGTLRRGSSVSDQVTVLGYDFSNWRLRPVDTETDVAFTYAERPAAPGVGGDLSVVAFNVLNYFTDFDGRGANDQEELDRQGTKIAQAMADLDADVYGLIEIENNTGGDDAAVDDLLARVNAAFVGARTFAAVQTGTLGTDQITQAVIYDTQTVELDGWTVLDDVDPFTRNTRPALATRFTHLASGETVTPIVNHFKSKGSGEGANADAGDGQAASNPDRVLAAEELRDWITTDPFFSPDDRVVVTGDLNAYAFEDPIAVFVDGGWTDLLGAFADDDRAPYTFVFHGAEGRLDYGLANPAALADVVDATTWAVNADEPRAKDYTSFNQPELYDPDAYRSSDHDPVVIGFQLGEPSEPPTPPEPPEPEPPSPEPDPRLVNRLAGQGRIETAIAISRDGFDDGEAQAVVLARADDYADALAGTPLAGQVDGPVLLTSTDQLVDIVGQEITRVLAPGGRVHVLGGEEALDGAVVAALESAGHAVERTAGPTRVETSVAVAERLGEPAQLLVTTGYDFPDALAAGAAAFADGAVLLTSPDAPHPAVDAHLHARPDADAAAIGGPATRAYPALEPVAGPDRQATALAVAARFFDEPRALGFARGDVFADALTGSAHVGRAGGPLLLLSADTIPDALAAYVGRVAATVDTATVYGGTSGIGEETVAAIEDLLR